MFQQNLAHAQALRVVRVALFVYHVLLRLSWLFVVRASCLVALWAVWHGLV